MTLNIKTVVFLLMTFTTYVALSAPTRASAALGARQGDVNRRCETCECDTCEMGTSSTETSIPSATPSVVNSGTMACEGTGTSECMGTQTNGGTQISVDTQASASAQASLDTGVNGATQASTDTEASGAAQASGDVNAGGSVESGGDVNAGGAIGTSGGANFDIGSIINSLLQGKTELLGGKEDFLKSLIGAKLDKGSLDGLHLGFPGQRRGLIERDHKRRSLD